MLTQSAARGPRPVFSLWYVLGSSSGLYFSGAIGSSRMLMTSISRTARSSGDRPMTYTNNERSSHTLLVQPASVRGSQWAYVILIGSTLDVSRLDGHRKSFANKGTLDARTKRATKQWCESTRVRLQAERTCVVSRSDARERDGARTEYSVLLYG